MDINPIVLSIPLYFLLIGIELIWEATSRKGIYRINDAMTNISCGISSQVTGALWNILSVLAFAFVYEYSIFRIADNWFTWIILFILIDLMYYWYHRASHEVNFLWNVTHVVHHQSEDYNLSVALRQSSLGGIFSTLFYLPLAFIGFSPTGFVLLKGFNLIYQFWIHTEAIKKLPRWFELIFNTPSHHRVHHGRNPKYIDRNHAGTLIVWDRLFGTFQEEEEKPTYGVTKPVNTWNPVWANVQPVVDMGKQFLATPGFLNKIKVLAFKPGWQPAEMGGYQIAPSISGTEKKFSTSTRRSLNIYLIAQYLFLLVSTSLFLFNHSDFSLLVKLISATYLMITIVSIGMLLESRKIWRYIEVTRNVSLPIISFFYFDQIFIPALVVAALFIGWFLLINRTTDAQ